MTVIHMEQIFIVQDIMSSPNQIVSSKQLDDVRQETTYKFPQETRNKISKTRGAAKRPIFAETLDFYGLKMCRESGIPKIKELITSADKDFKQIDPALSAKVVFAPLDMIEVQKGDFYEQILSNIRYRVLKDVIDQLDIKSAHLPPKSKPAMQKLIDHLKSVNVLGDEGIDKQLNSLKTKIETKDLSTIRKELQNELDMLVTKRGAYLELGD